MATILIAEDELIEAMAMQVTLEKWGHRVLPTITDGEDVAKVASTARPDLIMMDVFLANGVTGIEAARRIPRRVQSSSSL
jgi:CheY-like chemotaxis protein